MRRPIIIALWHPLNVLMVLLAVFAGLVAAWWLFPVGLLLWGVMVWQVAREPALKINHQLHNRKPLPQRFQQLFTRLERAQLSVFNTLASAPESTRKVLEPVQTEMAQLVEEAYLLCERMTALENYRLVTQAKIDLAGELRQIDARLAATQDPLIQREYQTSRKTLEKRLAKFETVTQQLERLEAQLHSLANTLDTIVAEVIQLQTRRAIESSDEVAQLVQQLREYHSVLAAFEHELTAM